jgi:hypothetical protein
MFRYSYLRVEPSEENKNLLLSEMSVELKNYYANLVKLNISNEFPAPVG